MKNALDVKRAVQALQAQVSALESLIYAVASRQDQTNAEMAQMKEQHGQKRPYRRRNPSQD